MDEDKKFRAYCFTINNYTDLEYTTVTAMDCRYLCVGKEIGESGTPHLQGYVYYNNPRAFKSVKKIMPRAHIEPAKGTPLQASEYCKKDREYLEKGELPKQGGRTDLENVRQIVRDGGRMADIVDVATSYQSVKMAEQILKYKEKPRNWKPIVKWYWGATGTGKSRRAYEELGEDCYTCMSTGRWFDGYDAHPNVLIDDMRKDFMKFHELLRMLDRYAFKVETKGGSRQFLARTIIITTPYHPSDMYVTREDVAQLLRRIDVIECFNPPDLTPNNSVELSDEYESSDELFYLGK